MITRRGPYQCRPEDALGKQRLVSGTMAALLGKQTDFDVSKAARFLAGMHAQHRRSFWNARATYFNGTSCEASFRSPLVPPTKLRRPRRCRNLVLWPSREMLVLYGASDVLKPLIHRE